MEISNSIKKKFIDICGEYYVYTDEIACKAYSGDKTNFVYMPDVVVIPKDTQEISRIMMLCSEEEIPVTPMGRKTGLAGSALAVNGGVILSLERLNSIIDLDEGNYQITVEPYVKNYDIQEAVQKKGIVLSS